MSPMSVTLERSQEFRGWLKDPAPLNRFDMPRTPDTSQEFIDWLKDRAPRNIPFIDSMFDTSQFDILPLKL